VREPDPGRDWLHAYLAADAGLAGRLTVSADLAASGQADGVGELVCAAFVLAARRRFVSGGSRPHIIQFVARLRAGASEEPDLIDPQLAEHELRRALGETVAAGPARPQERFITHLVLLDVLVRGAGDDQQTRAALLDQAGDVARRTR
jgi:hypothetical protein